MIESTATHNPTAPGDTDTFALLLKHGTQDLHDQAESGDFQRRMVDGKLLRDEFVAFLQQVRHVHAATEPILRNAAEREPRLAAMLCEDHFRLAKIDRDLADLEARPSEEVLPAAARFIEFVTETSQDPLSLVGVLYVKEGATNGNKIVAKRIRDGLGLLPTTAMGYLDPHGAEQRKRWYAFKDALNELDLSDNEKGRCLEAARSTFRFFMELSGELHARAAH